MQWAEKLLQSLLAGSACFTRIPKNTFASTDRLRLTDSMVIYFLFFTSHHASVGFGTMCCTSHMYLDLLNEQRSWMGRRSGGLVWMRMWQSECDGYDPDRVSDKEGDMSRGRPTRADTALMCHSAAGSAAAAHTRRSWMVLQHDNDDDEGNEKMGILYRKHEPDAQTSKRESSSSS